MEPCFRFDLQESVLPGLVTVGRFDGQHVCLACGTKTGKILVHDPNGAGKVGGRGATSNVRYLAFQKQITALRTGALETDSTKDVLFIGSETDLLAYDVDRNMEVFHKDVPDGVLAIAHGPFGTTGNPLVFAGGNCSIMGFDAEGKDRFWTVLGDNVCAMALCDVAGQGHSQLLVGGEDQEMRVYMQGGELLHEFSETEAAVDLVNLSDGRFGYALSNGAVGMYTGADKSWRVKMAATPVSLAAFDMTMDGVPDLIVGWSDGSVEVRSTRADGGGEVIGRDKLDGGIAGVVVADYRMDGTHVAMVVSTKGEVRGYLPFGVKAPTPSPSPDVADKHMRRESDAALAQLRAKLHELEQRKRDMRAELDSLSATAGKGMAQGVGVEAVSLCDPRVSIHMALESGQSSGGHDGLDPHVLITIALGIDAAIRMVVLRADGLFDDEVYVAYEDPSSPSATVNMALLPPKNVAYHVECKVVFGKPGADIVQVHETTLDIPAFALLAPAARPNATTEGVSLPLRGVAFHAQINEWLCAHFLSPRPSLGPDGVVHMMSVRNGEEISIHIKQDEVLVSTVSMELAADVVQSLLRHVRVTELNSHAAFPTEITAFRDVLARINDLQSVRLKLSADMAEKSNLSKGLLLQAEDARHLRNHNAVKQSYRSLFSLNRDLIAQYTIRCTNHTELLSALKTVNHFIQCASRLRAGQPKSAVVHACREALQANDVDKFIKVVESGVPLAGAGGSAGGRRRSSEQLPSVASR
eukprot:m.48178 g.48178  ORF g.48178 m.48178 type:complete len:754 (+) comp6968_c0_seq1:84-2345(+)